MVLAFYSNLALKYTLVKLNNKKDKNRHIDRHPAVNVLKQDITELLDSLIGLHTAVKAQLERNNTVFKPCKHFEEILFNKSQTN